MPISQLDYTDLATVKAYLGLTTDEHDAVIERLITAVSRWIDTQCERSFGKEDGAAYQFNGDGTRQLIVFPDLRSVAKLELKRSQTSAYEEVAASDYFLEPIENLAMGKPFTTVELPTPSPRFPAFTRGHRTVRVTGDWGWDAVPSEISEACVEMVAQLHKRRPTGGATETLGTTEFGTQIITSRLIPDWVKQTIGKYRRTSVFSTGV